MKEPVGDPMKNYLNNPLQMRSEIEAFAQLMKDNNIASYLEIGSMYGGTIWLAASIMPKGSRIVAVDLPFPGKPHAHQSLKECFKHLQREGFDAHLIVGDSTKKENIERARALGPYDAVFIDGNHSLPYVTADWKNYGPMGKMVAFHDINYKRQNHQPQYHPVLGVIATDVPILWREIKNDYPNHVEFCHDIRTDKTDFGIGVLWR